MTCLAYFARPGDDEAHGTQLFRVEGDTEADYKQTYYPQTNGQHCELVANVPFRPNTMLAFVNARGAHGARIPRDAPAVDRYSYQFYVAPKPTSSRRSSSSFPPSAAECGRARPPVTVDRSG